MNRTFLNLKKKNAVIWCKTICFVEKIAIKIWFIAWYSKWGINNNISIFTLFASFLKTKDFPFDTNELIIFQLKTSWI